jgi:general secretion pathway protein L
MSSMKRLLALISAAFRWWVGELRALIPERLTRGLARSADRLVLLDEGDALELRIERGRTVERLAVLAGSEDETKRRLPAILRRRGIDRAVRAGAIEVTMRLAAARGTRTIIDLPLIAESNLREVISFELDRHTPFNPSQAYYAYRILAREAAAKRLTVELTVVPRRVAADAAAVAAALGLELDRVELAADSESGLASGNLLPATAPAPRRAVARLNYALAAAAAVLAMVAIYLPISDAESRAGGLARDFAAVKQSAERAAALRKEIDGERKAARFVIDRKRANPSVSELLAEITRILPDDTFLSEWQLRGSELELTGITASSSELVALLEQSRRFRGTSFRSPVTPDKQTGRERFHIAVQVVQGSGT